jgi:ribonucleotide reductase beta subunit family protein with ferritin-like domain
MVELEKIVGEVIEKGGYRIAKAKIKISRFIPKISFDPYSYENVKIKYPLLDKSYELSKQHFWDDTKVFNELLKKYGEPKLTKEEKEALLKILSIIYYGEIVAMLVAGQLLNMVDDMDAKKVLSAQVIEEAKHVTAYQKYLGLLGPIPEIDPNSRCVLDDVLRTNSIALKMVGLHLLTETVAYYLFTALKESFHEPILKGLLEYIAKDEAKHVGFARKYLPEVINRISHLEQIRILIKQMIWTFHITASIIRLKRSAEAIGIDVIKWFERGTKDFLNLAYEIAERTKFSKFVIPKSVSEVLAQKVMDIIKNYSEN